VHSSFFLFLSSERFHTQHAAPTIHKSIVYSLFCATTDCVGNITFDDDQPSSAFKPAPGLNSTFQGISGLIERSLNSCLASKPFATNSNSLPDTQALSRFQDPGHVSFTYTYGSCLGCIGGVLAAQALADIGCAAAGFFTFGVGAAICLAAAFSVAIGAVRGCMASGLCCLQVRGADHCLVPLPVAMGRKPVWITCFFVAPRDGLHVLGERAATQTNLAYRLDREEALAVQTQRYAAITAALTMTRVA
jgi:hypothetical protein